MEKFRQYINQFTPINDLDWKEIQPYLNLKQVKKGEMILKEGQICQSVYFLEEGLLRFFTWKEGEDATKFFTIAPYFFTSQKSFTDQIPSKENIEALEDCSLWEMKREDAYQLLKLNSWNTFIRKLIQEVQYNTENILEQLLNETAEERYQKMLEEQNELLQRVPLKYLASYLGIAPQSLSRIRKKLAEQERT